MRYYVVDAFTDALFKGNPAGVCLLEDWPEDELMQNIAFENNLAETAFLVKQEGDYALRWFTPVTEVDLCGHATLASACALMTRAHKSMQKVCFHTQSGELFVRREGNLFAMDFPRRMPVPCDAPKGIEAALGVKAIETHLARDLFVLAENEDAVKNARPDFVKLSAIDGFLGFCVTAKGKDVDFVSRFFAPGAGIDEDPVTGSAHSALIPFWAERLGKTEMTARQLSKRGGTLYCKDLLNRVEIKGAATVYLEGEIQL